MLALDPKKRISIPEMLSHPWMSNHDELMFENDMIDVQKGLTRQSSQNFSGLEDSTTGE
jgi:serine/threonine protein kinase